MRAALDNRWLSRAGNLFFLVGVAQTVVRWVMGLPLNALGAVLMALGIAVIAAPRVARWRQTSDAPSAPVQKELKPPPSALAIWLQERLDAAATIAGQRAVRGNDWYFGAMGEWDVANVQQMHDGDSPVAPDLVLAYRADPRTGQTDGLYPPHDAAEKDRYYDQRLAWMRNTLRRLGEADANPTPASQAPAIGPHDSRYESLRDLLGESVTIGVRLSGEDGDGPLRDGWEQHMRLLIASAYGRGEEAHVFTPDLSKKRVYVGLEMSNAPRPLAEPIERIRELLGRMQSMAIRPDFNPDDWVPFDPKSYRSVHAKEITNPIGGERRCPWCGMKVEKHAGSCGCGALLAGDLAYKVGGGDGAASVAAALRLPPPPTHPQAVLADFYKEGEDLRSACAVPADASFALAVRWRIAGGSPEEQVEREDEARDWDERVSTYIWAEPSLKRFGPGWRPAGKPIEKAADHPLQSMFGPDRLAEWYDGKLEYLRNAIEQPA